MKGENMEIKEFNKIVKEQINRSQTLLLCKGEEYARQDFDRLKCFKTAGALEGKGQVQALAGMMAKHTVSIYDMMQNPADYTIEKWNEKITDHINYLLILRAMIEEEIAKTNEDIKGMPDEESVSEGEKVEKEEKL